MDSGVPQGSQISPLLFLIHKSSLYNKVRETGAHVVGIINDITIDKGDRSIDKKTATLNKVLQAYANDKLRRVWSCQEPGLVPQTDQ